MEYYSLLQAIHAYLAPRTYVEIGVRHGQSLTLAGPGTLSLGVDPDMQLAWPVPPQTRLHHVTSDEFFAVHDLRQELGGLPVDLAFIDGMHLFEFALRDFANLERHCSPSSVVLVHDCLPIDQVTSARARTTDVWSGDVWKLVACLRRHRPDLGVTTLDVGPTGMGVITNLDPTSAWLAAPDRLQTLYDEFVPLAHDDLLATNKAGVLNVVASDWPTVTRTLDHRFGQFAAL